MNLWEGNVMRSGMGMLDALMSKNVAFLPILVQVAAMTPIVLSMRRHGLPLPPPRLISASPYSGAL